MNPSIPCSSPPKWKSLAAVLCAVSVGGLVSGCRPEKAASSASASATAPRDVVATIDGRPISREELADALGRRSRALGLGEVNPQLRQDVLDELIREKVLLARAVAAGVDRDPELVRRWERMLVAKYEGTHQPDRDKQPPATAAEIERFYEAHAAEYVRPERIRVGLIQVAGSRKATDEKRDGLRARAERILQDAGLPRANFAELARLHSDDRATRYAGGDSGWIERGQIPPSWPRELADAAFGLETPGALAPLVAAGGSFYIVTLLERQPAGVRPLAEVRDRIGHVLKEQQRRLQEAQFYSEQRAGVNVEVNAAALAAVPLPAPTVAKAPGTPPVLPEN